MIGAGSYKNLNPYMAKKESALFRQRVAQILDSVRLQQLGPANLGHKGTNPMISRKRAGKSGAGSGRNSRAQQESSVSSFSSHAGSCGVVQGSFDEHGQPLEIRKEDLRSVAAVLRVFAAQVQNEIVGACLLARPADVHAYAYDYSKSCVLTIRIGGPSVGTVVSAAVVTLRIINSTTRCLEVSWVATLKEHRKRGYAALLFGYVQQIAAVMGIEAVLVLSSRTSVGYWLNQPRAQGHKRIIMVRSSQSSKRLSKGYSKYPWKKRKLEQGLRRSDVHEEPPECVQKFYDANSSFRFDHSKSIHVWYLLGLEHVDYLSLSRMRVFDSGGSSSFGLGSRSSKVKGKSSRDRASNKMSNRDKLKNKHGIVVVNSKGGASSSGSGSVKDKMGSSAQPKRSKSWSNDRGARIGGGERASRSASFSANTKTAGKRESRSGDAYKIRDVGAAKVMARRLRHKARNSRSAHQRSGSKDGTGREVSSYAVIGGSLKESTSKSSVPESE